MTLVRLRAVPLLAALWTVAGCNRVAPSPAPAHRSAVAPPTAAAFAPEIAAFETADRTQHPQPGGILFVGSSSIRFWSTLATDFPGEPVLNRGFGGSTLPDVVYFAPRIVLPYRPRLIVLYAGDNDIAAERTPAQVLADYETFARLVHDSLPTTRIVFLSIKPSPSRWALADRMRAANALIAQAIRRDTLATYVDVFTPMLGANGHPRPELFRDDSLHMTRAGYALWRARLAPLMPPESPEPPPGPVAVQPWLTTPDQRKELSREADVLLTPESAAAMPTIEVDERTSYQEMLGFGAAFTDATAYLIQEKMSPTRREALMRELFSRDSGGLGLSFMRVPMGASDFSLRQYSYDDMPAGQTDSTLAHFSIDADRADKLPLIRRALAINPRITIVASPWSPPGWMKTTNSLIKGTLRPRFYDSFADYFVKFIQAYAAEGVPVKAITVQNEPNFEPENYPGMRLEAPARARVIGDHVGPRLAAAGLETRIWDWDHNWDVPQSPEAVLADSTANRVVQGVAWHCYAGDVAAQGTVHDAYPDKDTYFTECSGGEWSPGFAQNLSWFVNTLIIGATRNWARGVALWNLALDVNHGPHTGGCGDCRGVVTIDATSGTYTRNAEFFALGHASRFVRPGAHRIASTTDVQGLTSVAFRNADDGSRVLIALNTATQARTFAVRWSGKSFRYTLPAGAVATFVWND